MDDAKLPVSPAAPAGGAIARIAACVVVLLVNAVPVLGVLHHGWSVAGVLVLYWFENLLVAACTCVRIATHRRLTRKRGHWRDSQLGVSSNGKPVRGGLLSEYATGSFVFTIGHGVFVAVIVFALGQEQSGESAWGMSLQHIGFGALVVAAMLAVELAVDLATIGTRSYAWLQDQVRRRMGRVVVLHVVIIFGLGLVVLTGSPLGILYLLAGLKTLVELSGALAGEPVPGNASGDGLPHEPPAWLLKFADRFGKAKGGAEAFRAHWKKDRQDEHRQAERDEETRPA